MSGSYNQIQQIHSFSFSANSAEGITFQGSGSKSAFEVMQDYVTKVAHDVLADTDIQKYIGSDWQPVWGPIVWSKDQHNQTAHSDNTMGAYYSPSQNLFVVAIAGTNPISPYGWVVEDFDVITTVKWDSISGAGSGSVSQGTATGLGVLLNMKDPSRDNQGLIETLHNFIHDHSISNAELAVSGHSLGGALSPVMALYLSDTQSSWDPDGSVSISAYPTAGPTPGNKTFANYYEKQINDKKIKYLSLYNPIDCVPQAWVIDNIGTIPSLYEEHIPSADNPVIGTISTGAAMASIDGAHYGNYLFDYYTQVTPFQTLRGASFDTSIDDKVTGKLKSYYKYLLPSSLEGYYQALVNVARFAAQAAVQHTSAYDPLLKITEFMSDYKTIVANDAPSNAKVTSAVNNAVKKAIGVDLDL